MTATVASAYPRKHFFREMFTRDISLEDCVLDLIDNAIDGLVRTRNIDISASLLQAPQVDQGEPVRAPARIEVRFSSESFEITDTCGGIPRDHALNDVFNFGHPPGATGGWLGVYGIGLKRAIFKIGEVFNMESKTHDNGFTVQLDVVEWSKKDDKLQDWTVPITFTEGASSSDDAGTTIRISNLREEVVMRLGDGSFEQRLRQVVSQSYGLFINRYVVITLNGVEVEAFEIPLAASAQITPGHEAFEEDGVKVELIASLARRYGQEWRLEPAGWYVLCNGRIVVAADKTELTGWGGGALPQFHGPKFRGFVGVAFFQSTNPLSLPWTTSKRGLNRESPVYQKARNRMRGVARPIITFLDSMYKGEVPEARYEREIADGVKPVTLAAVAAGPTAAFSVTPRRRQPKTTVRISFDAEKDDVEKIRKQLKRPKMGANQVGQHAFEYYLRNECPE